MSRPPIPPTDPSEEDLSGLIAGRLAALSHRHDGDVEQLVTEIRRRHRDRVAAVLLYGSYLRGKRDTLLDFYVLLDDLEALPRRWQAAANRWLPPNVYYLSLASPTAGHAPIGPRAKYATMTLSQFEQSMQRFHSYFWSRFTQSAGLAYARDAGVGERVTAALAEAVHSFACRVAPLLDSPFEPAALWRRGFALTYTCELRSESPEGVEALYQHDAGHFDRVLSAYAGAPAAVIEAAPGGYRCRPDRAQRVWRIRAGWRVRRWQGKLLSVLRLVKAAGTFDDPLDYLLWKIERHSGVYIAPTDRQRRYPLIFAWGLLLRLYRRGAFR